MVRGRGSRCRGQRSGLSHQSNVRLPLWGFSGRKGTGGRAGKPQAGGWAGRQAPKNLTCDPGRPHRLKGLRDAEAGSALCVGGPARPWGGGGGAGEMNMAQRHGKGPKGRN